MTDFGYWTIVTDFGYLTLMADFGFWISDTTGRFSMLLAHFGSWTLVADLEFLHASARLWILDFGH